MWACARLRLRKPSVMVLFVFCLFVCLFSFACFRRPCFACANKTSPLCSFCFSLCCVCVAGVKRKKGGVVSGIPSLFKHTHSAHTQRERERRKKIHTLLPLTLRLMEKAFEGAKRRPRGVQDLPHASAYSMRKTHGRCVPQSTPENERRGKSAEVDKTSDDRNCCGNSANDVAGSKTAMAKVGAAETVKSDDREEILIDSPTYDDDNPDTSSENTRAGDCDGGPTLMELAMWEAEVTRRQAEVARDVWCIRNSLAVLDAYMDDAAVNKHSTGPLEKVPKGTGVGNKREVVALKMSPKKAIGGQTAVAKNIVLSSDGDDDYLQLTPSRGEKPPARPGGARTVPNKKVAIDVTDL
ncbi:hypothetical protein TCDM_08283 [Trypanosoma cruzi Dm28c]|uniref:Uncharacterized protein n=1 Tax=Trypanosoma cruzi Dm28c TaxID=1416333 RepID=V5ASL6_TRYCR|nr:hypothetical protein TCDM_08283 [Trypanosoma cruzi Dm28c]